MVNGGHWVAALPKRKPVRIARAGFVIDEE